MANSLVASEDGLKIVDEARKLRGWSRTDLRFLEGASVSRSTMNRFYASKPILRESFISICKVVGIDDWQKVSADSALWPLDNPFSTTESNSLDFPTSLSNLERQLRDWFKALRYEIEDYQCQTAEYFEWIVRIPVRSRFDRILIRGILGEASLGDLGQVQAIVAERGVDEGWLVTDYRVSQRATDFLAEERTKGNCRLLCLTFDELIDQDVDFGPYIAWLEQEVGRLGIDREYLQLGCSKPEWDGRRGKYLAVRGGDAGAEPLALACSSERIDVYVDQWLEAADKNHVSILGEFGTGKTWFALHRAWQGVMAYQEAQERRMKRPRLPLLITLRDYAKALNVDTVIAGFFFVRHNIRLNTEVFDRLNEMGKLLIIFDGFDEMAQKMDEQRTIDNFWALAEVITRNSKVILTCRNEHFPTLAQGRKVLYGEGQASTAVRVAAAPKFEILNLHPLTIEQVRLVLERQRATGEAIEGIIGNEQLLDLMQRPLMMDLVLTALPDIMAGKVVDLARVYLYALKRKLSEDIKTERTFTSMADKLFFMCEVSWKMLVNEELTLSYRDFPEQLKVLFGEAIADDALDHWCYDMMGQSMLVRDDNGHYRPAHKSLLEFFVAFKLAAELGLLHEDFLALVREPGEEGLPVGGERYRWSDYWGQARRSKGQRGQIAGFDREEMGRLSITFGAVILHPALMDLLLPMLDVEVRYREMNPLLELMQWTRGKKLEEVGYVGSNAGTVLVRLNPCGLEYQDLSRVLLPKIDLKGAGLREINLQEVVLDGALTTEFFSRCNAIVIDEKRERFFTGHEDGAVKIWSIDGQEILTCRGHTRAVHSVIVSGAWVFSGSYDKTIKQWNISSGRCLQTFIGHDDWVRSVAVSGGWLFSASDDKTVRQWDIASGRCLQTFIGHDDWVRSVVVSGGWLFSGSYDKTIKQWSIASGRCLQTFIGHNSRVRSVVVSGEWLFSGSDDKTIKQWSIASGHCLQTFIGHDNSVRSLAVSEEWLFSGSSDNKLKQWDIASGHCLQTFIGHDNWVRSLAVSGEYLFSTSYDKTVKRWDIASGECLQTFIGHDNWVRSLAMNGEWLFSGSDDNLVRQWDIASGECLRTFVGHDNWVRSVVVSGKWLFSGSYDKTIKQWDISSGHCLQTFIGHDNSVRSLAVNGEWLFSGSYDKTVKQWDISSGECLQTFIGHDNLVTSVAVNGKWLFSGSDDQTVKQWDISSGECLQTFIGHNNFVMSVAVSGEWLFSGSYDKTVRQWDISSGECLRVFTGHDNLVMSVAVGGDWLFSGSSDNTLKQWDIPSGECLQTFTGHDNLVMSVVVGGDWLFSGSSDNKLKQWDIASGHCIATFDNRLCAGANITAAQGLTPAQLESLLALGAITDAVQNEIETS